MSQTDEPLRAAPQPTSDELRSIPHAPMSRRAGWVFWFQWVVANGLGWAVGGAVYAGIFMAGQPFATMLAIFTFGLGVGGVFGAVMGISFGSLQATILRQHSYPLRHWRRVSWLGGGIGGIVSGAIMLRAIGLAHSQGVQFRWSGVAIPEIGVIAMLLCGAVTGTMIGIAQHFILGKYVNGASRWVWANTAGWATGCAVSAILGIGLIGESTWPLSVLDTIGYMTQALISRYVSVIVLAAMTGVIGGAITGALFVRWLRNATQLTSSAGLLTK